MKQFYHGNGRGRSCPIFTKNFLIFLFTILVSSAIYATDAPVTVNTLDSQGNPITGTFKIYNGPNYLGEYDSGEVVQLTVGGTYKVTAYYNFTSTGSSEFVVAPAGNTFNYSTSNVTFHWSGGYLEYRGSGSWKSFGKTGSDWNSKELFPKDYSGNTLRIHIGYKWNDTRSMFFEIDLDGVTNYEKVLSQLKVTDHNGNPISGATARGGYAVPTQWFVGGSTNENGLLLDIRNGSNENLSYEMKVNKTVSVSAQTVSSIYEFQTELLTLRLETCAGVPLEGGHVRWGSGSTYGTNHFAGGNTDANGETSLEFFPGTYSFEMGYQSTTDTKISVNFPAEQTLTWKTTTVTLNYDNDISYGGSGDSRFFNKPTMELLPGTYRFHFRGSYGYYSDLTFTACTPVNDYITLVKVIDSNGDGIENSNVNYYAGGWHGGGLTDANGDFLLFSPNKPTSVQVNYKGKNNQKDGSPTSPVVFQTIKVTGELLDSHGDPLEASLSFYAGTWQNLNDTNPATAFEGELLPGAYNFDFHYNGMHTGNILQDITVDSHVVSETVSAGFNAGSVAFYAGGWHSNIDNPSEFIPGCYWFKFDGNPQIQICITESGNYENIRLVDSYGNGIEGGTVKYYASGWHDLAGETNTNGYILAITPTPVSSWKMYHEGASNQQNNPAAPIVFQTVKVMMDLETSTGDPLASDDAKYYASGWKTFGDGQTSASMELLPNNYPFKVYYSGGSNQKSQNVGADANVVFNTVNVTMDLETSIGAPLVSDDAMYYASGWKTFGTGQTSASMELLPNNYPFKVYYSGGSNQKSQNVGTDANVVFNTVNVTMDLETSTGDPLVSDDAMYYASGWKTFGDGHTSTGMELLPNNYPFKVYYAGASNQKSQNVGTDSNVVFNTENVTMNLVTSTGDPLISEDAKYYASGWKTFGDGHTSASMELLPNNYPFKVYYLGGSEQKSQNVGTDATVLFNTVNVTMELVVDGTTEESTDAKYYASGWKTFGDGHTNTSMELLSNNYPFKVYYTDGSEQKSQHVGNSNLVSFSVGTAGRTVTTSTSISDDEVGKPINAGITELKTYPNPFTDHVNISFNVERAATVSLNVYDVQGRLISQINNAITPEGNYTMQWNGTNNGGVRVQNGVYLLQLSIDNEMFTNRVIIE